MTESSSPIGRNVQAFMPRRVRNVRRAAPDEDERLSSGLVRENLLAVTTPVAWLVWDPIAEGAQGDDLLPEWALEQIRRAPTKIQPDLLTRFREFFPEYQLNSAGALEELIGARARDYEDQYLITQNIVRRLDATRERSRQVAEQNKINRATWADLSSLIRDEFRRELDDVKQEAAPTFSAFVHVAVSAETFINKWGPISLCQHLLPSGHCDADLPSAVPVSAFAFYARLFWALVTAGAAVNRGRLWKGATIREPIEAIISRSPLYAGEREDWSSTQGVKRAIALALDTLLYCTAAREVVDWSGDWPETSTVSRSPLLSTLVLQTVDALREPDVFTQCANPECQRLIDLRRRKRAPRPSERSWCDDCAAKGVHKRFSERTIRAGRRKTKGEEHGRQNP